LCVIQSILIVPKIQRTETDVARGEFDRRRFGQSIYHNTSDPVGNTLTTGGPTRLNEEFWENSIGIRDRNVLGGKAELSQRIDARDSNSLFFKPNNQADMKLSLNYTQPLMRGAGKFYNTSAIQLAGIKTQESIAAANRELQIHAMDVINAYWELTLHRYLLAQARISQERLIQIKQKLENRAGLDLISNFVSRAKAAIANQQQQIEIAKANVRSQEAILRQLVNAPELENSICQEIIPLTMPDIQLPNEVLEDELWSAILYRGDIVAIQQTIESAVVQRKLAKNELKPTLDFLADSYVRGLRGENQLLESWTDQFDRGRPSFSTGLTYQAPVGNRSAKASLKGRELEIQKLIYDYSNALKTARSEIEQVVEESKGTFAAAQSSIEQILASQEEVQFSESKVDSFFGDNPSVSNQLNDLLDAIGRLTSAENQMADRQIRHMLALAKIKFESGTLMTITAE
jgi:outer membrane protein TolC